MKDVINLPMSGCVAWADSTSAPSAPNCAQQTRVGVLGGIGGRIGSVIGRKIGWIGFLKAFLFIGFHRLFIGFFGQ